MQWQFLAALLLCSASVGQGLQVEVPGPIAPLIMDTPDTVILEVGDGAAVVRDDLTCALCIEFFEKLKPILTSQKMKKDLEKVVLKEVCSRLPRLQELECKTAVRGYGQLVFKVLQTLDAKTICQDITMCPHNPVEDLEQKSPLLSAYSQLNQIQIPSDLRMTKCQTCHFVLTSVIHILTSDDARVVMFILVDRACLQALPELRDQCVLLLGTLAPKVVRTVVDRFIHPQQICHFLQYCAKGEGTTTESPPVSRTMAQYTTASSSFFTSLHTLARDNETNESHQVSQKLEHDTVPSFISFFTFRRDNETMESQQVSQTLERDAARSPISIASLKREGEPIENQPENRTMEKDITASSIIITTLKTFARENGTNETEQAIRKMELVDSEQVSLTMQIAESQPVNQTMEQATTPPSVFGTWV